MMSLNIVLRGLLGLLLCVLWLEGADSTPTPPPSQNAQETPVPPPTPPQNPGSYPHLTLTTAPFVLYHCATV